jgi:hypothetical protein
MRLPFLNCMMVVLSVVNSGRGFMLLMKSVIFCAIRTDCLKVGEIRTMLLFG